MLKILFAILPIRKLVAGFILGRIEDSLKERLYGALNRAIFRNESPDEALASVATHFAPREDADLLTQAVKTTFDLDIYRKQIKKMVDDR